MYIKSNKGITIVEILIVVSIMVILLAVILPSLLKFRREQALKNAVADVVSLLNKAKSDADSLTVSTDYSVHFETGKAVYYIGSVYNSSTSTNKEVTLDTSVVSIPASGGISLNGGGSEVTFTRLTGDSRGYVSGYGTIIIRLVSDATRQITITISKTGTVSIN
jgi:type II secretory pathway pseudopilin PulG